MRGLLGKLWNNTFHLESKFLRTAWQLFVPGLVTAEFFKGKQERYPHPIRLFGIVMFFFLLLLNRSLNTAGAQQSGLNFSIDDTQADTTYKEDSETYLRKLERRLMLADIQKSYATLPPELQTKESKRAMDSLLWWHGRQYGLRNFSPGMEKGDTIDIRLTGRLIRIPNLDIARYEPDELIRRAGVSNWLESLFIRQAIKSFKRPDALGHAYIGSFTWTVLAIITFMAGMLSVLYRRRRRYYVEHFIFLLHFHTGALLLLTLAILSVQFGLLSGAIFLTLSIVIWIAMFFGLWRFYGQAFGKTLAKWLIFSIIYACSVAVFFVIGLLVVFAFY